MCVISWFVKSATETNSILLPTVVDFAAWDAYSQSGSMDVSVRILQRRHITTLQKYRKWPKFEGEGKDTLLPPYHQSSW
jgi:hypothetical protein